MTVRTKEELKAFFNGTPVPSVPTAGNYEDLIDTMELSEAKTYANGADGWYRVATGQATGAHNIAVFRVVSNRSSYHTSVLFSVTITYGQNPQINLLAHSKYSSGNLTQIRLVYLSTYDQPYVEVYLAGASTLYVEQVAAHGWVLDDGPVSGSIPGGYTALTLDITSRNYPQADIAPWAGITGKPSTYPPSTHQHPGTDITSIVASATTASDADKVDGIHASGFFQTGSPITTANVINAQGDIYLGNDEALLKNRMHAFQSPDEHFDGSSRPAGWSFRTETSLSDNYTIPSHVNLTGAAGVGYVYTTLVSSTVYMACVSITTLSNGGNCGIRLENSANTDYYVEFVVMFDSANKDYFFRAQYREGTADTNHYVDGPTRVPFAGPHILYLSIGGTRWTSWSIQGLLLNANSPSYNYITGTFNPVGGLNFTPNRMGFKAYNPGSTWEDHYCDWFLVA